ncbi:MAG TPA: hypothetical protein VK215_06875 [Acidimicrobiales bacterium]|nr:hypothetical protein [Acidimicrobiales bacterium]
MMRTGARLAIFLAITSLLVASCSGASSATKHKHELKHEQAKAQAQALRYKEEIRQAMLKRAQVLKAAHPLVTPTTAPGTTTSAAANPSTISTVPTETKGQTPAVNPGLTLSKHKILLGVTPSVTSVRQHVGHARHRHGHGHNHGLHLPHNH